MDPFKDKSINLSGNHLGNYIINARIISFANRDLKSLINYSHVDRIFKQVSCNYPRKFPIELITPENFEIAVVTQNFNFFKSIKRYLDMNLIAYVHDIRKYEKFKSPGSYNYYSTGNLIKYDNYLKYENEKINKTKFPNFYFYLRNLNLVFLLLYCYHKTSKGFFLFISKYFKYDSIAIIIAARYGNLKLVKEILKRSPECNSSSIITVYDSNVTIKFTDSSEKHLVSIDRDLFLKGNDNLFANKIYDVYKKDFADIFLHNKTDLFRIAIMSGNLQLVKFLVEKESNKYNCSIVDYPSTAAMSKYYSKEIFRYLQEIGENFSAKNNPEEYFQDSFYCEEMKIIYRRLSPNTTRLRKFYDENDPMKSIAKESIHQYGNVALFKENKNFWKAIIDQNFKAFKSNYTSDIDNFEIIYEILDKEENFVMQVIEYLDVPFFAGIAAIRLDELSLLNSIITKYPDLLFEQKFITTEMLDGSKRKLYKYYHMFSLLGDRQESFLKHAYFKNEDIIFSMASCVSEKLLHFAKNKKDEIISYFKSKLIIKDSFDFKFETICIYLIKRYEENNKYCSYSKRCSKLFTCFETNETNESIKNIVDFVNYFLC